MSLISSTRVLAAQVMVCVLVLFLGAGMQYSFAAEKGVVGCLRRTLAELFKPENTRPAKKEMVTNNVQLVWYPKAGYIAISHVELGIDGVLWDATAGYKTKAAVEIAERAAKSGQRGFFRFKLAVTEDELNNLRTFLERREGKPAVHTCVSGACNALDKSTGIIIPFPFSKVPTLSAVYLTAVQKLGYSRVVKVEYVGRGAIRNLISTEIPYELGATASVAGFAGLLIVTGFNQAGQLVKYIVPLQNAQADDDDKKKAKNLYPQPSSSVPQRQR